MCFWYSVTVVFSNCRTRATWDEIMFPEKKGDEKNGAVNVLCVNTS